MTTSFHGTCLWIELPEPFLTLTQDSLVQLKLRETMQCLLCICTQNMIYRDVYALSCKIHLCAVLPCKISFAMQRAM
jgi:hypothetical protein